MPVPTNMINFERARFAGGFLLTFWQKYAKIIIATYGGYYEKICLCYPFVTASVLTCGV